jgi:hypothetical protein
VITDGMELDRRGNLYLGDLEHNAIVRLYGLFRLKLP